MRETKMPDDRTILALSGADRVAFLQDLVTNDVTGTDRLAYAALLTPQGKYLADFFVLHDGDRLLIDVDAGLATGLVQRLTMYRLRRNVQIETTDLRLARGTGPAPAGAHPDPRHPEMGWRRIVASGDEGETADETDWDALRVAHQIPQSGIELIPGDSYPLEMGLDRLHGVDFRKGCYVGQEVTARMKHKTELKKGLATVTIDAPAPVGTPITDGARVIGTIFTQSGGQALAWLRFDRAEGEMRAGDAVIRRVAP